jgi:hypothetical protein
LPAAAVLLEALPVGVLLAGVLAGVLLVAVLGLDELPLLQAAAPSMAIAASGARYLKPRRLTAVLLRGRFLICVPLPEGMMKRPHSAGEIFS